MEIKITVLTPAYNRARLLPRLYESLQKQNYADFEWVIVDDGSTDDTKSVVQGFVDDCPFPIHYYYKENGGKHTAVNLGVKKAKGELVFIADSDDMLTPEALQTVAEEYAQVAEDNSFCGVCGLDCDLSGKIIGSGLKQEWIDANAVQLRTRYGVTGDLKEVFKTSVLKEFPFPEIPGERFCPEALVWNRIARKYKLRYFNRPIYQVEYQVEGLTSNIVRIRMQSPIASMMTYAEMVGLDIPWRQKMKAAINYYRFKACLSAKHAGEVGCSIPALSPSWHWTKPLGLLMHIKDTKEKNDRKKAYSLSRPH